MEYVQRLPKGCSTPSFIYSLRTELDNSTTYFFSWLYPHVCMLCLLKELITFSYCNQTFLPQNTLRMLLNITYALNAYMNKNKSHLNEWLLILCPNNFESYWQCHILFCNIIVLIWKRKVLNSETKNTRINLPTMILKMIQLNYIITKYTYSNYLWRYIYMNG